MRLTGLMLVLGLLYGSGWSQVLSGTWKGMCIFQKEEMRIELAFAETGNSIKGESYLKFRNNCFYRYTLEGFYNSSDSTLLLREVNLIEQKKRSAKDNCPATYVLDLHRAGYGYILPDKERCHGSTKIKMISESTYYEFDRVGWEKKPERKHDPPAIPDSLAVFMTNALQRTEHVIGSYGVNQDVIRITLYDNGEVDGDTVSLFFNGAIIAYRVGLNEKALNYELVVDKTRSENKLLFIAHNLGRIPPNTGAMRIEIDGKIHRQFISTNLDINAAIKFIPGKSF